MILKQIKMQFEFLKRLGIQYWASDTMKAYLEIPLPPIFYVSRSDCYEDGHIPVSASGEYGEYRLIRKVKITPNPPTIKEAE